ncbi:MAG: NAD-dependent epimerase/dehydratase family protein [Nitrospinales bacterium]
MDSKPMRIGITGASGFIGSRLAAALANRPDEYVVSVFRRRNAAQPPDLTDFKSFVEDKDLIYHLAGVNRGTDEEILQGNILFSFRLTQAVKTFGKPARIVFASSAQVYKPARKTAPLRETHPAEPVSLYGVCKKAAEDLIRLSGLDYTLLRLANVYGPGCRPYYNSVVATFCDRAARNLPLFVNGDGTQGRDFIYIDDAVRALELAGMQRGKSTQTVFNVSSGKASTLRQVLRNIRRCLPESEATYQKAASPGGPSYCCDNARFMKQYGWKPKTTLAKGIGNTIQWVQEKVLT